MTVANISTWVEFSNPTTHELYRINSATHEIQKHRGGGVWLTNVAMGGEEWKDDIAALENWDDQLLASELSHSMAYTYPSPMEVVDLVRKKRWMPQSEVIESATNTQESHNAAIEETQGTITNLWSRIRDKDLMIHAKNNEIEEAKKAIEDQVKLTEEYRAAAVNSRSKQYKSEARVRELEDELDIFRQGVAAAAQRGTDILREHYNPLSAPSAGTVVYQSAPKLKGVEWENYLATADRMDIKISELVWRNLKKAFTS